MKYYILDINVYICKPSQLSFSKTMKILETHDVNHGIRFP